MIATKLATANLAMTLALAVVPAAALGPLPDVPLHAAFWAVLGAGCRWAVARLSWREGLVTLFVGVVLAAVLDGVSLPFLREITGLLEPAHSARIQAAVLGMVGPLVIGFIHDTAKAKFKK